MKLLKKKKAKAEQQLPAEEEMPVEEAAEETEEAPAKPNRRFLKYCLSVICCFGASFLLYTILQLITDGRARASLAEALICFLVCMGSCLYVYQTKVFEVRPKGILPMLEFVIAHIFSVSVWQLTINSMISHKYSIPAAFLVASFTGMVITYFFYKDVVFSPEAKHLNKRWVAAILAAILCIPIALQSFISTIYHALDTSNYVAYVEPTTKLDDYRVRSEDGKYEITTVQDFKYPLRWDDNWFTQDLTVYNPDLAYAAAVLSVAAYYESRERINDVQFSSEDFWGKLGFDWINVTSFHYRSESLDKFANLLSGDSNGAAYVVAGKDLITKDGSNKKLLVISICGSLGFDFADDLLMGNDEHTESGHKGFSNAAAELATGILEHNELITDDTVVFICGHSRGAAVANLLAVELEEILRMRDSRAQVCTYTFAAPNAAGSSRVRVANSNSLFNVINPYDLVTMVPFTQWGFDRYGEDILLFDPESVPSEEFVESITSLAGKLEGKDYHIDYTESDNFNRAVTALSNAAGDSLSSLGNPLNFFRVVRSLLRMEPKRYLSSHSLPLYVAWLSK